MRPSSSVARDQTQAGDRPGRAISANNDPTIGGIIADAMDKVGKDGVITVEEAQTFGWTDRVVEGMQFDKGYISPYFVTDTDRMEVVLEDPYILIRETKISAVRTSCPCSRRSCRPAVRC